MKCFTPEEIVIIGTSLAIEISKNKDDNELAVIKCVLNQIIATISTFQSQVECYDNTKNNNDD